MRQIDRALFAYHKLVLNKKASEEKFVKVDGEATNKQKQRGGRGVIETIRRIVYDNAKLTGDDLYKAVFAQIKTSKTVINSTRYHMLHAMHTLKALGALTPEAAAKVS